MKRIFLLLLISLTTGCATRATQSNALLEDNKNLPKKAMIQDVPFIKQKENHCGPASLAMLLKYRKHEFNFQELTTQTFTPLKQGTFQTDLITAARRQGTLAIPILSLESLLKEIAAGNPVLVFQNLGLESIPKWHYAVAVGYNLKRPEIVLHSGPKKNHKVDLRVFEHSWALADYWGIVVIKPGELSATASELSHVAAAAHLEQLKLYEEAATAYLSILEKWPKSLSAHIGMGNIRYAQGRFIEAVVYLKAATIKHPHSSIAWHNLAIAQGAARMIREASQSSHKAISLSKGQDTTKYRESLKEFIPPGN